MVLKVSIQVAETWRLTCLGLLAQYRDVTDRRTDSIASRGIG